MAEDRVKWVIVVHGGAKEIPGGEEEANRRGCLAALAAGRTVLEQGGAAVDAVESAIRVLEDDPAFNAGIGSVCNAAGEVQMDAAIMDGATLDIGAVAAVRGAVNPITVAGQMLRQRPTLLVGEGAERFAEECGRARRRPPDLAAGAALQRPEHDTVGCVVLDGSGNLACGTSTGGLSGSPVGRVGDSPLPGCGFYADNLVGATALSGDGESISRTMLAAFIIQELARSTPEAAARASLNRLDRVGGEAGCIIVDRHGGVGVDHNSRHFPVASMSSGMPSPRFSLASSRGGL